MDNHQNSIVRLLSDYYGLPVTGKLEEVFDRNFRREEVPRKTILFMNGESNTRHYFVEKGLLRLYLIDASGKEINLLFAYENQVIGDLTTPAPTRFNLESVEESVVWSAGDEGLKERNPKLLQRLPQYHVASYLGVSPEFLSKIIARTSRSVS